MPIPLPAFFAAIRQAAGAGQRLHDFIPDAQFCMRRCFFPKQLHEALITKGVVLKQKRIFHLIRIHQRQLRFCRPIQNIRVCRQTVIILPHKIHDVDGFHTALPLPSVFSSYCVHCITSHAPWQGTYRRILAAFHFLSKSAHRSNLFGGFPLFALLPT